MNMIAGKMIFQTNDFPGTMASPKAGVVVVVSDDDGTIERLAPVCDFLDLRMVVVSEEMDLDQVLLEHRPMAVIADIECSDHDGFYTMQRVARHDRELPLLLLTNGDATLMGAADAMQEMVGLTAVTNTSEFPVAAQFVAFLFTAGRRTGCMRLIPV